MNRCAHCPTPNCLGSTEMFAYFCDWAASEDFVKRLHVANRSAIATGNPLTPISPLVGERRRRQFEAVSACPHRGSVLPHTEQPECGCRAELTECRARRGANPGKVTLQDCLDCVLVDPIDTRWHFT